MNSSGAQPPPLPEPPPMQDSFLHTENRETPDPIRGRYSSDYGDKKVRNKSRSGNDVEDIGSEKRVMRARLRRVSPAPPMKTLISSNNNKTQGWDFFSMCCYANFKLTSEATLSAAAL